MTALAVERRARAIGERLFFIVGCPRSGTTLLQRVTGAHTRIVTLAEQRYLPREFKRPGNLTPEGLPTPQLLTELVAQGRLDPPEDALVGTQAPERIRSLAALHSLWPHARFVHAIRDGRDVCQSTLNWRRAAKFAERFATWGEDPVSTAALWWEWHVRLGREAAAALPAELYHEIHYEALVGDPEAEAARLCEFLQLPYDEKMLRFHEGREVPDEEADAKHAWRPLTPGLRDWRTEMTSESVERFEAVAGALLSELGYPRAARSLSPEGLRHAESLRTRFEGRPRPAAWETRS